MRGESGFWGPAVQWRKHSREISSTSFVLKTILYKELKS